MIDQQQSPGHQIEPITPPGRPSVPYSPVPSRPQPHDERPILRGPARFKRRPLASVQPRPQEAQAEPTRSTLNKKLVELLMAVRANYVFPDSFDSSIPLDQAALEQLADMHQRLVGLFTDIVYRAMPEAPDKANEFVYQIVVKSTAFCSAVALGEIDDTERLATTAACIALCYWVDHAMDRGDQAMIQALVCLLHNTPPEEIQEPTVRARHEAIAGIERLLESFAADEGDLDALAHCIYEHTLFREMHVVELSQQYLAAEDKEQFWAENAEQISWLSITSTALIFVAGMVYQLYRRALPELPGLPEILANQEIIDAVHMTANAAIRGWDDLGDRFIDAGAEGSWGNFVINLFNQPHPVLLNSFLTMSGVPAEGLNEAVRILTCGEEAPVVEFFVELVRSKFAAISTETATKYEVFLTMIKRVVEAGFVNRLSDIRIADIPSR